MNARVNVCARNNTDRKQENNNEKRLVLSALRSTTIFTCFLWTPFGFRSACDATPFLCRVHGKESKEGGQEKKKVDARRR